MMTQGELEKIPLPFLRYMSDLENRIMADLVVPNTPNTMVNCIGALVRQRDGDTSAIWMVDIGFCNLKI